MLRQCRLWFRLPRRERSPTLRNRRERGEFRMTKVEAYIRPQKLDEVQAALSEIGVQGLTVTEVRGAGKQKGFTQHYRGAEYTVNLIQKVKLEIVVPDSAAPRVAKTVADAART